MDNETTGLAAYDDEIDLRELFSVLWEGKLTIALVTALSAVISVSVALYLPNKYTSEALLAPRQVYSEHEQAAVPRSPTFEFQKPRRLSK